jgi:predicted PurR-regulated permease PerM
MVSKEMESKGARVRRRLPTLSVALVSALIVAALYFAQAVFIPFALAVLLTFLLSPVVSYLEHFRVSRGAAVALVIVLVFCALAGAGWILVSQIGTLAAELPKYRHNIAEKVRYVRSMGKGSALENFQETVKDLQNEFEGAGGKGAEKSRSAANEPAATASWPAFDPASLGKSLGMTILMLGLVIFMLAQREELRNRLIRVIGYAHLAVTTRALDDAGRRISSYLLMSITINGCFGLVVGTALFLIGLPYAFLWGFLSVPLLFIPVIGFWVAAALPTILSLAVFPGWWWPLAVVALFLVLKMLINTILEPMLYGRSVGVFPVPLLMMLAFWTWLWGGIGLLLATPMTVCLVVFARHVPQLESLRVLLSDEPAMEPRISYYQRLLAMDAMEALAIVRRYLAAHAWEQVYDEVQLPALSYARADLRAGKINEHEHRSVITTSRQILERAGEGRSSERAGGACALPQLAAEGDGRKIRIIGCAAQDEADEIALLMLREILNPERYELEVLAAGTLTSEIIEAVAEKTPPLVCVAALAPGGLDQTRYICKRLRALSTEMKIVVGRWGEPVDANDLRDFLHAVGADQVGGTLCQTRDQITNLRPFIGGIAVSTQQLALSR